MRILPLLALCAAVHRAQGFVVQTNKIVAFKTTTTSLNSNNNNEQQGMQLKTVSRNLGRGPTASPPDVVRHRGGGMATTNTRTKEPLGDLPVHDPTQLFLEREQTTVQGGSLRTWSFANPNIDFVQVLLKTEGRPLDADISLWNGPDNTPCQMKVYLEDGGLRTFYALISTPNMDANTVAIRNTGMLEFPMAAVVEPDDNSMMNGGQGQEAALAVEQTQACEVIQGGALRTYPFVAQVDSVAVLIKTDGRPLNARIELLQGPNNNKQVLELYTEDGMTRPFFGILETPGSGNVVRVVNTAPVEFPLAANVMAYSISNGLEWEQPQQQGQQAENAGLQLQGAW